MTRKSSFSRLSKMLPVRLLLVCCLFAVATLTSCGGGTDGSGVRSFGGQVIAENANPLPGALVTVAETGDSAETDEFGNFTISTRLPDGQSSATFVIQTQTSSTSAVLADLSSSSQVDVLIVVDRPSNTAQVIPLATPTAQPTSTSAPIVAPSATPTAVGTIAPTATMLPGSTATPIPSVTPTNTPAAPAPTTTPTPIPVPESDECRCDLDLNSYVNANDFQTAINIYASGNFDFDGNGVTSSADLQAFIDVCDPLTGSRCLEHE